MMIRSRHRFLTFILALFVGAGILWFAGPVIAQNLDTGLNFATETGLSSQDPRVTVARIIRIALGFLGVLAIGLMMYAGFIWMTAKGEEEKINQAKKIMLSAGIGLVIILASFGIATFVMSRLLDATGGSGSNNGGGGGGIGSGSDLFTVSATTPAHQSVNIPRNAVIRFRFTKAVEENTVNESSFTVSVAGEREVNGNYIEFIPEAECEAPNDDLKCFPANTTITAEALGGANGIFSVDDKELSCSGSSNCRIEFTTGEIVDTDAPRINLTSLQVCAAADNILRASSIDNYGVSRIDFFVEDDEIGSVINSSNPFVGSPFDAEMPWNAGGWEAGETIALKATAYDLDMNEASAEKDMTLSAGHCCNGVQDGDETGIDCGGSCLSCEAMARPAINQVTPAGGFCSNDPNRFCRKATEVQDCGANASCDLGTPNGATGNFITLIGSGFGTARGKVFFTNAAGAPIEAQLADVSGAGNPSCTANVWKDNQVIAVVPADAGDGRLSIQTADNKNDATDDDYGSLINDFKKNTIDRPGLCGITPVAGKLNDVVEYQGVKLTASEAYYGNLSSNLKALVSSFPAALEGTASVPNLATGATTTFVLKDNVASNYIPFTKESEPYDGPIISSIEPASGPVGQYVTIRGSGFGATRQTSKVFFGTSSGFEADYSFPDICIDSLWSDKQIIIKVPSGIGANADYQITLERTGFPPVDSGTQTFRVTTGSPDPGVCRVQPSLGQANSEVIIWGEYFRDKDTNSTVRFHNNQNQQGTGLTLWEIDQSAAGIKPWKVITTVPQTAATGPLRVLVGSPYQQSNPVNFAVGQCTQDADCGAGGATCCAAGLPEAGKCKASAGECYGSVATSVYEWRFSTGSTATCAPDQQQCGTVCCAGGCDPTTPNKCAACIQGMNECGDGTCCNQSCTGNPSTCPDPTSCSGYSYNQCLEGYYCPNSPGLCSPYPGTGEPVAVGQCGDNACNSIAGCENGACRYDAALNRCVKNNTQACKQLEVRDGQNQVITINNQPAAGECEIYNNEPRWHLKNWVTSCPSGWTRLPNNRCVDAGSINGACTKCDNPFSCQMSGNQGYCAVNQAICPSGSTCDPTDNQCKKPDQGTCDCCCRKDNAAQDCCGGLSCEGSCGSGQSNLGLCTGCVVNGVPDDSLCNCTGSTGKFCDASTDPRGICRDCSAITDLNECSSHSECCVDAKNGNKCTSVAVGGARVEQGGLQYCGYFNCTNAYPNSCDVNPVINGVYNKINSCQMGCTSAPISCANAAGQCDKNSPCPTNMRCDPLSCECKEDLPPAGEACRDPLTQACTGACSAGYQCLLPTGYGNTPVAPTGPGSSAPGDDTCRCCCKPPTNPGDIDTCKQINENLSCLPDQGLCTSPSGERGLCCGCSKDGECGDVLTTGCGLTGARCCQSRPSVAGHYPAPEATGVCRNTVVEAIFSQKMDIASFSTNAFLVGDYGTQSCPAGFSVVAQGPAPESRFAQLIFNAKKIAAKVFPALLSRPAFAVTSNFCYVPGSVVGYDVSPTQSKVSFRLNRALDPNIMYYAVLKGDAGLANLGQGDEKDYYNANIVNTAKVGMIGSAVGRVPVTFNSTDFENAEIWSFRTGSDICALDRVNVTPSFQLFQQPGQAGYLEATATDRNSQLIQPIANFYGWSWNWSSDNTDIARVEQIGAEPQANVIAGNQQDAQTLGRAKATVTVDNLNQPSTVGRGKEGTGILRSFLCENPWPVYYAYPPFPPGYNWPWKDDVSGIEFYYCRDKSGVGTIDDLPALVDDPVTSENNRKICMFGQNVGRTCASDANCNNLPNSCLPEVLREFFFFRETEPGIPSLSGQTDPAGGKVNLSWAQVPNAAKYKIYYGLNPGQYTFTTEVVSGDPQVNRTISNLVNGLNYYFTVTAISSKNQESIYSNEVKIKPTDTTPPPVPQFQASAGDGKIALFWEKVPGAVSYIAYLGVEPRPQNGSYAISVEVRTDPIGNNPNIVFSSINNGGLNNATTYYVSVRAKDQYNNISDYAPEIAKRPNQPYLISATPGNGSVNLKWLPFVGATGYTINYTAGGGGDTGEGSSINVSASTFERLITGLSNGTTYTFTIKANKPNGQSDASNERSVAPGGSGGSDG